MWSVVLVVVVHPLNADLHRRGYYDDCPRCLHAYSSVPRASLTLLQQAVAMDDWGWVTLTVVENYPSAILIYVGIIFSIFFGMGNIITATIIDNSNRSRETDGHHQMVLQRLQERRQREDMMAIFQQIDPDNIGKI